MIEEKAIKMAAELMALAARTAPKSGGRDFVVTELKERSASKVFRLGDIRLYECPLSYISEESAEIIRLV